MAARTNTAKKAAAPEVVDETPEPAAEKPEAPAPAPAGKVVFVPNQHATGVVTPSGAVFSFTPLTSVKLSRTDAEDLVATGFGSIQGG